MSAPVITPVSALGGMTFEGHVRLAEQPPRTMLTLKGDLGSAAVQAAATAVADVVFPAAREASCDGESGILWMAPDELLLMCPRAGQAAAWAGAQAALEGTHHLLADVSDARSVFLLEGEEPALREVLAKLSPADTQPAGLSHRVLRRSRLAQVPAAFWLEDERTAGVVAFRSVAEYVFGLLKTAIAGGRVGHF